MKPKAKNHWEKLSKKTDMHRNRNSMPRHQKKVATDTEIEAQPIKVGKGFRRSLGHRN